MVLARNDGNLKRKNRRYLGATCGGWAVEDCPWTNEKTIPCDCGGVFHVLRTVVINRNVKKKKTKQNNNNHEPSHGFFPFICLLRVFADIFVVRGARDLGVPHAVLSVVTRVQHRSVIAVFVDRVPRMPPRIPHGSGEKSISLHAKTWAVRDFVQNKPFCDQTARLLRSWVVHRPFYYFVLLTH